MKDDEETLMKTYGIHQSSKIVYHYKNHCYDKLEQAVNYAKIDMERKTPAPSSPKT